LKTPLYTNGQFIITIPFYSINYHWQSFRFVVRNKRKEKPFCLTFTTSRTKTQIQKTAKRRLQGKENKKSTPSIRWVKWVIGFLCHLLYFWEFREEMNAMLIHNSYSYSGWLCQIRLCFGAFFNFPCLESINYRVAYIANGEFDNALSVIRLDSLSILTHNSFDSIVSKIN